MSRDQNRERRLQKAMRALDGYSNNDGYSYASGPPITIRLAPEDIVQLEELNETFFEGELNTSVMCRVLIRKGIQWYKNLK